MISFEKDIITPRHHQNHKFFEFEVVKPIRATVVQFRPGRQISNLKTQVQILAVALELIHELRGHSANIRKEDNKLQHLCVLEILLYYELKLLNLYDGKNV